MINHGHVHNGHAYATLTHPYIFVASFLFLTYAIFSLFLKMKETAERQGNFFSICLTRQNPCRSWRAREESNS